MFLILQQPVGCDGAQVIVVNDTLTGSGRFGYHTVEEIPAGARNITIAKVDVNSCFYLGEITIQILKL